MRMRRGPGAAAACCWAAAAAPRRAEGLDNGAGGTPPMGFNDWNEIAAKYPPWRGGLNETTVLAVARALAATGLRDKGYQFLNLDCGYSPGRRGTDGRLLQADPQLFPSGIKAVADQIRAMGLKFGIYTSGRQCCAPKGADDGNLGKEAQDAAQFVNEWGVEYVKNDDCGSAVESFAKFRDALNATGKHVFYSVHTQWTHDHAKGISPADSVAVANCWRTTNDISNSWSAILDRAQTNNKYAPLAGPGSWNDPDMLEVGNSGVSDAEGRSHFALWAVMKAPLLIGTDVTAATPATLATLGNEGLIAVNQDALGVQGTLRASGDGWQVWAGPLQHNCSAVVVVNLSPSGAAAVRVGWDLLPAGVDAGALLQPRDLWARRDLAPARGGLNVTVPLPHDCAAYTLCPAP